jgi:hypothetical protein
VPELTGGQATMVVADNEGALAGARKTELSGASAAHVALGGTEGGSGREFVESLGLYLKIY